jgi:hypothetical protein
LKQLIPKYSTKTVNQIAAAQSNDKKETAYGTISGNILGNSASDMGSSLPPAQVETISRETSKLPLMSLGSPQKVLRASDTRIGGATPEILPSNQKVKDFPLSTKNKSMPPVAIPNNKGQTPILRNLPPVVLNPIQLAKS